MSLAVQHKFYVLVMLLKLKGDFPISRFCTETYSSVDCVKSHEEITMLFQSHKQGHESRSLSVTGSFTKVSITIGHIILVCIEVLQNIITQVAEWRLPVYGTNNFFLWRNDLVMCTLPGTLLIVD